MRNGGRETHTYLKNILPIREEGEDLDVEDKNDHYTSILSLSSS